MSDEDAAERNADVTVVIPVYNDPRGIETTLRALIGQSIDETEYDVAVVDNGSTDETRRVIREFSDSHAHVNPYVEDEIQGSYAARNEGIRKASVGGDVLAFLDADLRVGRDWLARGRKRIAEREVSYMGCDVELTIPDGEETVAARYDEHTGFPVRQYVERHRYAPTCALFVRREVFEDVGLFDPRLISGGDLEFGNRVADAGYELGYAGDVTAYHPVRSSLRDLARKNARVGRGHCQLQRYYPERYGTPGIPPRPSGIKTPDRDLPLRDRLAFGAIEAAMTTARASGYVRELANPTETGAGNEGPPRLER